MNRTEQRQQWLSDYFQDVPYKMTTASADASFRSYYRITTETGSYILMDAPPAQEDCHQFVVVLNLLSQHGIHVPELFASDFSAGFLLLGDLGDQLYLDHLDESTVDDLYGQAIETLISLQSIKAPAEIPPYDQALLHNEMQLFVDWFINQHLDTELTASQQSIVKAAFELLMNNALEQPQVLVHRDFHSRNLMLTTNNSPGVLDFQDAVVGAFTYDLVSLLKDCYIQWSTDSVAKFLAAFRHRYNQQFEQNIDADTLTQWFDWMGAQRHLKAIGIFCRLHYRDGKPGYLNDIPRTMDYLLETAAKYPELNEFEQVLKDILPALPGIK